VVVHYFTNKAIIDVLNCNEVNSVIIPAQGLHLFLPEEQASSVLHLSQSVGYHLLQDQPIHGEHHFEIHKFLINLILQTSTGFFFNTRCTN